MLFVNISYFRRVFGFFWTFSCYKDTNDVSKKLLSESTALLGLTAVSLTHSTPKLPSCRNQSIDLQSSNVNFQLDSKYGSVCTYHNTVKK